MNNKLSLKVQGIIFLLAAFCLGCETSPPAVKAPATPTPAPSPTPLIKISALPVTLPLLNAMFQIDESFPGDLRQRVQLTNEQISQLATMASAETEKLREDAAGEAQGSTAAAGQLAQQKIAEIIGAEKEQLLSALVLERWNDSRARTASIQSPDTKETSPTPVPLASPTLADLSSPPAAGTSPSPRVMMTSPTPGSGSPVRSLNVAFNLPSDTRVVVNAPAHQMDVFENGQLVKSYKISIGYPEFPIPDGMRKAGSIIFNPTWTPPDEPWVESSKKVKVGQKVAAGDKLNPLGVLKIPIGLPSLIHGGKRPVQIGSFGSHGCVGLTDQQAVDFAKRLSHLGGVEISDAQVGAYKKTPTETKVIKLNQSIPVEFRYDTILVSDGKLQIYRDVYDRDTNTEENLRAILGVYGVTLEDLTEDERKRALDALRLMSRTPSGKVADADLDHPEKEGRKKKNIENQQLTKTVKGQKEIVVEITALAGKGYPAPVELDTGVTPSIKVTPRK